MDGWAIRGTKNNVLLYTNIGPILHHIIILDQSEKTDEQTDRREVGRTSEQCTNEGTTDETSERMKEQQITKRTTTEPKNESQ